jgi:hypothetical protein
MNNQELVQEILWKLNLRGTYPRAEVDIIALLNKERPYLPKPEQFVCVFCRETGGIMIHEKCINPKYGDKQLKEENAKLKAELKKIAEAIEKNCGDCNKLRFYPQLAKRIREKLKGD